MRKDYEGEKQGKKVDKNEGNRHLYLTVNLGQNKKTRGKSSTLLFFCVPLDANRSNGLCPVPNFCQQIFELVKSQV